MIPTPFKAFPQSSYHENSEPLVTFVELDAKNLTVAQAFG